MISYYSLKIDEDNDCSAFYLSREEKKQTIKDKHSCLFSFDQWI